MGKKKDASIASAIIQARVAAIKASEPKQLQKRAAALQELLLMQNELHKDQLALASEGDKLMGQNPEAFTAKVVMSQLLGMVDTNAIMSRSIAGLKADEELVAAHQKLVNDEVAKVKASSTGGTAGP